MAEETILQPSPKFQEPEALQVYEIREPQTPDEDPILILDIKLVKDKPEKIVIYERDIPEQIVERFCS